MSFTLELAGRDRTAIGRGALAAWVQTRRHFTDDLRGYHNETTGVYFTMSLDAGSLTVDVNYNRPTYFGAEAFEVLGALCKDLDLLASNPQGSANAAAFDGEALLASYVTGNTAAVRALTAAGAQQPAAMVRAVHSPAHLLCPPARGSVDIQAR